MSGPAKRGQETLSGSEADPAAAQFSWRFEAQLRCWTGSTEGDAITSGPRPRFPGRSIGTARFTSRRYTPLSVTGSTIRIGVIGYGYWGSNLVRNFSELDGCAVT